MVWFAALLGVKVVVQLACATPLGTRVQLVGAKVPAPLVLKLTVPVGVVFVPASVSLTVAVQAVSLSTATLAGMQLTVVEVLRLVTLTVALPWLVSCVRSPLYVAVTVAVPAVPGV